MPDLIGQFHGKDFADFVRLSIFDTHLAITLADGPEGVGILLPFEELGRVAVEAVLGQPMLVLEDLDGVVVAAVRMGDEDIARAEALIDGVRGKQTRWGEATGA